jgi:hypothetical protein
LQTRLKACRQESPDPSGTHPGPNFIKYLLDMTMTSMTSRRQAPLALILAGVFAIISSVSASAQQEQGGRRAQPGFIDTILQGPKLRADPVEPADWVKARRPNELQEPVRVQPGAEPARKLLTPDEIRQREAQLDAARSRHDQLSGRKPTRGKFASAAGEPTEKKKKAEVRCTLTCNASSGVQKKK